MGKTTIRAQEMLEDIRSGMSDIELMTKYDRSENGLLRLFRILIEGLLQNPLALDSWELPPEETGGHEIWKCPACDMPQTKQFDTCPECGVVVNKLLKLKNIAPKDAPNDKNTTKEVERLPTLGNRKQRRQRFHAPSRASEAPEVSFTEERITFTVSFTKDAKLTEHKYVNIHPRPDDYEVDFEFHSDSTERYEYRYKLTEKTRRSATNPNLNSSMTVKVTSLLRDNPWLGAIVKLDAQDRRFPATSQNTQKTWWRIRVCPAFESSVNKSEISKIRSNLQGIYRYRRWDGEVIYIGRGQVRDRPKAMGREEWDFDIIEYSEVPREEDQKRWEGWWIRKHKESHQGHRPLHNLNNGG